MGRLPILHPDFVYRPLSLEQRKRLSLAHTRRLGIPDGYCKIYGALVPIEYREEVRKAAAKAKRLEKTSEAVERAIYDEIRKLRGYRDLVGGASISKAYESIDITLPTKVGG